MAYNPNYRKPRTFYFSKIELRDLGIAWILLSIAFAFVLQATPDFTTNILISAITVGIGFLLHELAHKFVAQYYKCHAEFRADYKMLALALVLAIVLRFIFAAPGAVMVQGAKNIKEFGHIAIAGPFTNYALALLFIPVPGIIGDYGYTINVWLGLFNMIPFGPLDGAKVLRWSKKWFGIAVGIGLVLFLLPF